MKLEDLDCRQREIVDAVLGSDSKILVLGGPGTGKTTTALWAGRCYLDSATESPPPRVLFLTFSRSAIRQIMTRSPGVLSGLEDRVEIMTFHALCFRLIQSFGRYAGHGTSPPVVQSEARTRLLGYDGARLRYDDLISEAIRILECSIRIRNLVNQRWGLVICDEAQDCNEEQSKLLQLLATRKLLLLGDANQMIYTFIPGVSPERFRRFTESADHLIELLPRSHRDPSGAIPALAEAVRLRQFDDPAVIDALESGRLTLHFDVDTDRHAGFLVAEIKKARIMGSRDVAVFAHSNAAVADLAELLNAEGVDHALIGIPEAHAEALGAMATQCAFAVGLANDEQVRESLAIFLTAAVRGRDAPHLARALIGQTALPGLVEEAIGALEAALLSAANETVGDIADIAAQSWVGLSIAAGKRVWRRAASHFARLVAPVVKELPSEDSVRLLMENVDQGRNEALVERDYTEHGNVKLMTYHQTKGREADTVIHVFHPNDFVYDSEPFEEPSRLLNVAISRARQRVVIMLPAQPSDLLQPFMQFRQQAGREGELDQSSGRSLNEY